MHGTKTEIPVIRPCVGCRVTHDIIIDTYAYLLKKSYLKSYGTYCKRVDNVANYVSMVLWRCLCALGSEQTQILITNFILLQ